MDLRARPPVFTPQDRPMKIDIRPSFCDLLTLSKLNNMIAAIHVAIEENCDDALFDVLDVLFALRLAVASEDIDIKPPAQHQQQN
jgi:hypothetical protein